MTKGADNLESTASLIDRIRDGDEAASETLWKLYLPELYRWAHGRLPAWARDDGATGDIVQETVLRTLDKVKGFEPRRKGAFFAYLRCALMNKIRDQLRAAARHPRHGLETEPIASEASPLETAIGKERLESYESALATLSERHQEAVFLRVELGVDWKDVAEAIGSPSPNAARMVVARALVRLEKEMSV